MSRNRYHEQVAAAMLSTNQSSFTNHANLKKLWRALKPDILVACLEHPLKKSLIKALFHLEGLVNPLLFLGIDVEHSLHTIQNELM